MRFLLLFAVSAACFAQDAGMKTQLRLSVENGLQPAVRIRGRAIQMSTIQDRMKALNVRGVSIAVIHQFRIDWAKGYGILDDTTRKPVDIHTLFQAGSISKPVSVTAALRLVELGKLNLDEDVNVKLKSWKLPENEFTKTEKVTLRRTMSHSAGLTVHGFAGYEAGEPIPTLPQILDGIKPANSPAVRVDTVPGTISRYSGGGTTIMQLLMIDVTGRAFPDLLHDLVLSKAGMNESTFEQPLPERYRANAAAGYGRDGTPVKGKYHTYPEMAAAGLWTNASDLARFAIEMGLSREGKANHILKQATVEEMMTVQKGNFGLGFGVQDHAGKKRFGHGGADEGFQSLVTCSFDGEGAAILVNSDNGSRLADEIVRSIASAYKWPDAEGPVEKVLASLTAAQMQEYAGSFAFDSGGDKGQINVKVDGDHLSVEIDGGSQFRFYAERADHFFMLEDGETLEFQRGDGKVTGARLFGLEAKRTRQP